jgi:flagellar P-ring protein precursor FlgI
LEKYVWQQLPEGSKINPKEFIESLDTAVVEINALLPALSLAGEHFDIQLKPLSETQTTSLRGGRLYTAELKEKSRFVAFDVYAKTLADAHGPVFTFTGGADNEQRYCIFGGGLVQQTVTVSLVLQEPDFYTAGVVRNRINERFGPGTANAISDRQIQISFPKGYRNNKIKFLRLISALYLSEQDEQKKTRIDNLITQLQQQTEKLSVEIAIEAIGRPALDKLNALLEHPDPAVRFSAARILLNIGDQRGLDVLQKVIEDSQSPRRLEAIEAVGQNAKPKEVLILLAPLLDEERIDIRLAAYEQLLGRNCPIIKRTNIANNFFLDRVLCGGPKAIYAYRKDSPRLVLFGSPLYCEKEKEIFVTLEDGAITINARPEDKSISITRRHPSKPRVIGPLKSGFEAGEIILTLCQDSETDQSDNSRPGLGIAYPQVIELLEKMCQSQAVIAQFIPGPLSETLSLPKEMEK